MNTSEPDRPQPLRLPLLDTKELSALLGRSVSSIERDDKLGRIPAAVKIGRHKRWRRREVAAWIDAGCPARADWSFNGSVGHNPSKPKAPCA